MLGRFNLPNIALKIYLIFILLFSLKSEVFYRGKFKIKLQGKPTTAHFSCGLNSRNIFVEFSSPAKNISRADKQRIQALSKEKCQKALRDQVSKIAALLERFTEIDSNTTDPVCAEVTDKIHQVFRSAASGDFPCQQNQDVSLNIFFQKEFNTTEVCVSPMFNSELPQEDINCTINFPFPLRLEHTITLVFKDNSSDDPNHPDDMDDEMNDEMQDDNMNGDESDPMN